MAVLSDADRQEATRTFIRRVFVRLNQTASLTKAEARLLIDGVDVGLNDSATAINQAIDASVRTKASPELKAFAVAVAALKRAGVDVL